MPSADVAAANDKPHDPDDQSDRSAVEAALGSEVAALAQQVLRARDAVVGAEAELSVAKARTAEVEHHLHVRTAEVDELQAKVLELTAELEARAAGQTATERPNPVARRLSPLLARTANLTK